MKLTRRHALGQIAIAFCAMARPAPSGAATTVAAMRPGLPPSAIRLDCAPSGRAYFRVDGIREQIVLPALDAGIAAVIPLAGREIVLVSFGVPIPLGWLDLVAFIGWDNTALRVLGLELARYRGLDGASADTRISAISDGARVRLTRESFVPRPPPMRGAFHEGWTDYLHWQDGGPLADAPVRTPLPGTNQARLSYSRAQIVTTLSAANGHYQTPIEPSLFEAAGLLDPFGTVPLGTIPLGTIPLAHTQPASARLATLAR